MIFDPCRNKLRITNKLCIQSNCKCDISTIFLVLWIDVYCFTKDSRYHSHNSNEISRKILGKLLLDCGDTPFMILNESFVGFWRKPFSGFWKNIPMNYERFSRNIVEEFLVKVYQNQTKTKFDTYQYLLLLCLLYEIYFHSVSDCRKWEKSKSAWKVFRTYEELRIDDCIKRLVT